MSVTVYHNPKCSTSTKVVALLREAGHDPKVVEYLKTGWTREQLQDLTARSDTDLKGLLRKMGTPAEELGLLEADVSDDALLSAMVEHPILVNRPIVDGPKGVVLARPIEKALTVV
ncbi:arsenate reductase family protein [Caulobacter sp. RHG1]|uniref:arsenate reductase family protein n=1 Tax=Caulobacter sp. (strain RHG1) TaxID=2545762 RepID=UPI001557FE47|nr:arsenate reductase family protein [Caulobacter sp. RHG1]NQE61746.1 Arsenate reductase glutaredoxin-coupled, glutaredoxin-like family [Caulobacter sp. RHG1]